MKALFKQWLTRLLINYVLVYYHFFVYYSRDFQPDKKMKVIKPHSSHILMRHFSSSNIEWICSTKYNFCQFLKWFLVFSLFIYIYILKTNITLTSLKVWCFSKIRHWWNFYCIVQKFRVKQNDILDLKLTPHRH